MDNLDQTYIEKIRALEQNFDGHQLYKVRSSAVAFYRHTLQSDWPALSQETQTLLKAASFRVTRFTHSMRVLNNGGYRLPPNTKTTVEDVMADAELILAGEIPMIAITQREWTLQFGRISLPARGAK